MVDQIDEDHGGDAATTKKKKGMHNSLYDIYEFSLCTN
jgi:hypothetical protein